MARGVDERIRIFVSSTVYNVQYELQNVYELLTDMGYEVLMSMQGNLPIDSTKESCFDTCLKAVGNCDVFLGFIRPQLGSGRDKGEKSITYKEFERAFELNLPRYVFTDYRVVFANDYCKKYAEISGIGDDEGILDMKEAQAENVELYRMVKNNATEDARGLAINSLKEYYYMRNIEDFLKREFGNRDKIKNMIRLWQ